MVKLDGNYHLIITYDYAEPIELVDFTESMKSLAYEYKKHLRKEGVKYTSDTRLYVKNVKEGSITIGLGLTAAFAVIANINHMATFLKNLKEAFNWLMDKSEKNPGMDKQDIIAAQNIIGPVTKDTKASMKMEVLQQNGNVYQNCTFVVNNEGASAIDRKAEREIENMTALDQNIINNTILAIHQASKATGGFKGVALAVGGNPKKVTFDSPDLKQQILDAEENMFKKAYIVDLRVERHADKVVLYNVLSIKEVINLDEVEED